MEQVTITTILESISLFFTEALEWAGDLIGVITGHPLLILLVVAMPVCGFAVGLLNRLLRSN